MPKGKKFDATKKHFQEKEIKLNRKMREYEASVKAAIEKVNAVQKENDRLRQENEALKRTNKELMELHNFSNADIKVLIEHAHSIHSFDQLMNIMGSNPYT